MALTLNSGSDLQASNEDFSQESSNPDYDYNGQSVNFRVYPTGTYAMVRHWEYTGSSEDCRTHFYHNISGTRTDQEIPC